MSAQFTNLALYRRLLAQARPYWPHIAATLVLGLLSTPLALLSPLPLQIAVDSVIGSHPVPRVLDALSSSAAMHSKTAVLTLAATARDEDLVDFRRAVERDIAIGAPPAAAASIRVNAAAREARPGRP